MKVTSSKQKGSAFEEYGFIPAKVNRRLNAICRVCHRKLQNTAAARLRGHRNICHPPVSNALPEHKSLEEEKTQISSVVLKKGICDNLKESEQLVDYSKINQTHSQKPIQMKSADDQSCFDNINVKQNFITPSIKKKSTRCVIDDINTEEDDIFIPEVQYINEAIHGKLSANVSKRLLDLQEIKTKAEAVYYQKKAAYFQKQIENLEAERKLILLQAQKLRLEIDKMRNDFLEN